MKSHPRRPVRRAALAALTLSLGFGASLGSHADARADQLDLAAPSAKVRKSANAVPDRYIVVLEPTLESASLGGDPVLEASVELAAAHGARLDRVYSRTLRGFSAEMSEAQAEALAADPRVAYVEEDGLVSVDAVQSNATFGIDRLDQRQLPLSGTYRFDVTASNVNVYVIDSGIRATHSEFGDRVELALDFLDHDDNPATPANTDGGVGVDGVDCTGHGTHVAGTIAGTTFGVAKQARIFSLKALGRDSDDEPVCSTAGRSGRFSEVIDAVEWVTANHVKPAVVNMSLGATVNSSTPTATEQAIRASISAGVTYVIAAGNTGVDAMTHTPARVSEAITVGATDATDTRASFFSNGQLLGRSNFGTALDVFAPGVGIVSAGIASDTATATFQGTSMAAPHAAGVAALFLSKRPQSAPADVQQAIVSAATANIVADAGVGSPNRLLSSRFVILPNAPSNATAALGQLTVTVRWRDNSDNETSFSVLQLDPVTGRGRKITTVSANRTSASFSRSRITGVLPPILVVTANNLAGSVRSQPAATS